MIALESLPARSDRILAQRSADSIILLNPQDGRYYTLDEVAARIWELCDGTRCVADVVALVHAEYDAPIDTIRGDVVELLQELVREQLLAPF